MKRFVILFFLLAIIAAGCARTWIYQPLDSFRPSESVPPATVCQPCHQSQVDSWKRTRHAAEKYMARVTVAELRECGACHDRLAAHAADPSGSKPRHITSLTRTERNTLCGKCHYNLQLFGNDAINPHDRHALFANVALEGQPKQIACLECHSGHLGKSEMLVRIKAHICYECHTSAMFTMGILFQIPNWVANGYMCQACHTVHGGSATSRWGRMGVGFCIICHFVGVAIVG